jgi:alpha-L-rhamnosidase
MEKLQITHLRCEYFENPLGLGERRPRLSWVLESETRGQKQTAYRVQVAASQAELLAEGSELWDSGRVESGQSTQVVYGGQALDSRQLAWWQVTVWDKDGLPVTSPPAWFELGLLERSDWQAEWIGSSLCGGQYTSSPAPYLRRAFLLSEAPLRARLYITALGLFEPYLNGQRVGSDRLAPGWTDYRKRVSVYTYDVTGLLHSGHNVLGTILGDGWYCGYVGWRERQYYGDRPRLLAQLEIIYANGDRLTIASDGAWQWCSGPILEADLMMGESYDARRELPGWNEPGYDAQGWQPVQLFPDVGIQLEPNRGPAVRCQEELTPVAAPRKLGAGWIFDLGQNMVGHVRIKLHGKPGATLRIRYAEVLNPDGSLYLTNLREARATDYYTFKGEGEEIYEPRFTFHGFRYVELRCVTGKPGPDSLTGIVIHSDLAPAGSFTCSDPLINQLQHNIQWGQKGNFVDIPTDCPQRNERLGWTGDAQVFMRTAAFNRDVAAFFTRWQTTLADAQGPRGQFPSFAPTLSNASQDGGPAWADAGLICPWTLHLAYGDSRLLAEHYGSFERYMNYLIRTSRDLIRCHPDTLAETDSVVGEDVNGETSLFGGYGDWLSIKAETPKDLIGTAFLAYSARLMSQIAAALGKPADVEKYTGLFEEVRRAFQHRFVTPAGLVAGMTQTGYVLALHFDLLPEELRPAAVRELVRDIKARKLHLSTGFVGAPYLLHVLARFGQLDTAYALLKQKSWPSWLYPVTQGATTIWERWDGWRPDKGFQD